MNQKSTFLIFLFSALLFSSCGKVNLLTLEQERQLGLQSKAQVESTMNVLPRASNLAAYQYVEGIRDAILNSGQLAHKNDFAWEIYILKDDATLNAFCTPGGYMYVYSGLIKYLNNGSALAGVIGHECAHADNRHTGKQLTTQMGIDFLLNIISGASGANVAQLVSVLANLGTLKFDRSMESEADACSVKYLCPTQYHNEGASYFFQKLTSDPSYSSSTPTFLSTHPDPGDRITAIQNASKNTTGCYSAKVDTSNDVAYKAFKTNLGF